MGVRGLVDLAHAPRADGTRVLLSETVAEMSVNQMGDNRGCKLMTAMPEFSADAEFFPEMEKT